PRSYTLRGFTILPNVGPGGAPPHRPSAAHHRADPWSPGKAADQNGPSLRRGVRHSAPEGQPSWSTRAAVTRRTAAPGYRSESPAWSEPQRGRHAREEPPHLPRRDRSAGGAPAFPGPRRPTVERSTGRHAAPDPAAQNLPPPSAPAAPPAQSRRHLPRTPVPPPACPAGPAPP